MEKGKEKEEVKGIGRVKERGKEKRRGRKRERERRRPSKNVIKTTRREIARIENVLDSINI